MYVYPLDGAIAPSIRLENIRDGIENYDLLAAVAERAIGVVDGVDDPQSARRWVAHRLDIPVGNIDLRVYSPGRQLLLTSETQTDNEWVEHQIDQTGVYTVAVNLVGDAPGNRYTLRAGAACDR